MTETLMQAFVYLVAAVVAVPIASRLGLGSVLGYLIAGVFIGPVLGVVGDVEDLQHVAEFGVVMMLFVIGLELEPKRLWDMRARLLGLGGLQVVGTAAAVTLAALALGLQWQTAVVCGLILSLSSTAIVLQTLQERNLMRTDGGQASFSVLLFQDIAVIPMLALIPLLPVPEMMDLAGGVADAAHGDAHGADHGDGHGTTISLVDGLPAWAAILVSLGAVGAVILGGVYLTRPVFRIIAATRLREMFTAAALLLVVGIAVLMSLVGLSPALGTFLAGVVLANSEFRHELESDIDPFKGLLLGLFFITVGAGIDFGLLFGSIVTVLAVTIGLIAIKAAILLALSFVFRVEGADRWLFALGLAQAGEFGFVLVSFSAPFLGDLADLLLLAIALSMLLTPALFIFHAQVIARKMGEVDARPADEIDEQGPIIIAGHGRFGQMINRILRASGYSTVVIDRNIALVEGMRRFGTRTFYGDATRPDLLHAAGLREAKILAIAIDEPEETTELVRFARRERPDLHIIARAHDRRHVYELYNAGADDIIRETFDSAVRAGRSALEALGIHPFEAEKAVTMFRQHDLETIRKLAAAWKPGVDVFQNTEYMALVRQRRDDLARAMQNDRTVARHERSDRGWTPPPKTGTPLSGAAE